MIRWALESPQGRLLSALVSPTLRVPWLPSGSPGFRQVRGVDEIPEALAQVEGGEILDDLIRDMAKEWERQDLPGMIKRAREQGYSEAEIEAALEQFSAQPPTKANRSMMFNIVRAIIDKDAEAYDEFFTRHNKRTVKLVKAITGVHPDQHTVDTGRRQAALQARAKEQEAREQAAAERALMNRLESYGHGFKDYDATTLLTFLDTSGISPRSMATFKKRIQDDGEVYAIGDWIERKVAAGFRPEPFKWVGKRGGQRSGYRLMAPDETIYNTVSKGEHDYARWLREQR